MKNVARQHSTRWRRTWAGLAAGAVLATLLPSGLLVSPARADRVQDARQGASFDMEGVSVWFRGKFSEAELLTYRPDDFRIEYQMCNCSDRPEPHYPYIMVFFATPKGDLVGRPDRKGFETVITRLAVRHGETYCDVESEEECYGSFSHPCDFSDFRYGAQLAPYFPSCKSMESPPSPEAGSRPELMPVRHHGMPGS